MYAFFVNNVHSTFILIFVQNSSLFFNFLISLPDSNFDYHRKVINEPIFAFSYNYFTRQNSMTITMDIVKVIVLKTLNLFI
jgi:hypothetical protein